MLWTHAASLLYRAHGHIVAIHAAACSHDVDLLSQRLVVEGLRRLGLNRLPQCSVAARAPSASTANALDLLILLQLRPWHAADAGAVEVGLFGLYAA